MAPSEGVTGFWHAGITVSDLDRSLAFYVDALGLELIGRHRTTSVAERILRLPGATGEVAYVGIPGTATGMSHCCFVGGLDHEDPVVLVDKQDTGDDATT